MTRSTIYLTKKLNVINRETFGNTSLELDNVEGVLANVSQRILLTNVSLDELERKVDALQSSADSLKDRAINLQEANVEGNFVDEFMLFETSSI